MHPSAFHLIETLRVDKNGIQFLEAHLKRMKTSAKFFGFTWVDNLQLMAEDKVKAYLSALPAKLRICLYFSGEITIEITPYLDNFIGKKKIWLYPEPVSSDYIYLYHKSCNRHFYEDTFEEASALGYREVVYVNERGELTEGSRTSVFIQQGEFIFTPPLYCGVLAGIYRKHLLDSNFKASEKILYPSDLEKADKIWCVNSLRQEEEVFLT